MILTRLGYRALLIACITGVLGVVLVGGGALAFVEQHSYLDGIWLAFSVVSTTGFGEGPKTAPGQVLAMGLFVLAAACWFGIALAAVESAMTRFQRNALIQEAMRPLARHGSGRLYGPN